MKTYLRLICLLSGFIGLTNISMAQYRITGSVADSTSRKPLDYITISWKNEKSIALKSTLTTHGTFLLDGLQPGRYAVAIIAVGYRPALKEVLLDAVSKSINIGPIYLVQQAKNLKEVVITADRPMIKQQADRIIYDLQADPESKANNVLTMMRKVPFISIDANNNLLLKGNSSFKVLINGKPSGMVENNLKDVLQSMPASTIQSIEVITNPPAKYDAEGLTGIINIITNKKIDNGFKGTLNANGDFPSGGPGIGTSFSAKQGKLGIAGFGGANYNNYPLTSYSTSRQTFGTIATNLQQNGTNTSKGRNGYFGTEISYDINPYHLLSAQFNINGNHNEGQNDQLTTLTNQSGTLQSYGLNNTNNNSGSGLDAGINYQLGFKTDKSKFLTFSYRYYNYNNSQFSNIGIVNQVNYPTPNYQQENSTRNSEKTLQADYVQQIKKLYVEGGVKGILRNNKSNFDYLSQKPLTNQFELEPGFSDRFNYNQDVYSLYNSYRYSLNSWSFSGGARVEATHVYADFIASQTKLNRNFFNIIPNISINKEFKDKSSLSFGFNQRIKRPNIRRLNPFVDRSNPNSEVTGNPDLRPVLNNNVQLSYNSNKKLSVTAALSYGFINNIDLKITTVDPLNNITRTTYQNTGKASRLGLDYNLNYPINNQWNISANGNFEYFEVSGLVGTDVVIVNKGVAFVSASSGYKFNDGWRLNANITVHSRGITDLQGTSNAFANTSVSINKELVKNKLSLSAYINNPFTKFRYNISKSFGPDYVQLTNTQEYFRSFSLGLNYNFGRLKGNIRKNKRGIKNDDISN